MKPARLPALCLIAVLLLPPAAALRAQVPDAQIVGLPDYDWYAGCFGTACGNLMGYWDRHGLPDFYTSTNTVHDGVAPLHSFGVNAGIQSLWASRAGVDGRPLTQPGHIDDYWTSYEDTGNDPYVRAGRPEHAPDCIGDFIGLSQKKFNLMNGECDGNIDAYSFVYWATNGLRRTNYNKAVDIQSGLREWTKFRGYDADVFTQLAEFNPQTPPGQGYTWSDLKAEIDAGFPLLIFLQNSNQFSRSVGPLARANPEIHGMLAYGYEEQESFGVRYVYVRTSWASGEGEYRSWSSAPWLVSGLPLHVRGVIGFHPRPRVRSIRRQGTGVTLSWDGPSSIVSRFEQTPPNFSEVRPHRYQLHRSTTLTSQPWPAVGVPTTDLTITIEECCDSTVFYSVELLAP